MNETSLRKPYEPPEIFVHELPENLTPEEFAQRFAASGKPLETGKPRG